MTALSPPKHPAGLASARLRDTARSIAQAFRYLGAVAVLATGVAHIEQYSVDNVLHRADDRHPVSVELHRGDRDRGRVDRATPARHRALHRRRPRRFRCRRDRAGVLSLAALFVSESSGLFGFVEHGYRMAIVVAIVAGSRRHLYCSPPFCSPTAPAFRRSARVHDEPPAETPVRLRGRSVAALTAGCATAASAGDPSASHGRRVRGRGELVAAALREHRQSGLARGRTDPDTGGSWLGVVFDARGDVVTNAHVVANATRFVVTLASATATPQLWSAETPEWTWR